ncbi:MAG: helix-turn-helix domain-containing protein [Spirulinaceae cyanobacterium]
MNQTPKIAIPETGLLSILNKIESQLLESEVCRQAIAKLKPLFGKNSQLAETVVQTVGREAIKLTIKQVAAQSQTLAQATSPSQIPEAQMSLFPSEESCSEELRLPDGSSKRLERPIGATIPLPKKHTKVKKLARQEEMQYREQQFRKVGHLLKEARQAQSISIRQLNNQTLVPLHQIEAIEAGIAHNPAEDIYVRGFVRRLGNALGLNGVKLVSFLPKPKEDSVLPSWNCSKSGSGMDIKLAHLYVGYTAMVAGSLGGLAWMGNQGAPSVSVEPEVPATSEESISSSSRYSNATPEPKTNVAPPETLGGF